MQKNYLLNLEKNATETYGMLQTAFRPSCMDRASVFEWHKRFKEGRESVRDDERYGRSKEVNRPELIGQRVRVTMLGFKGSSGRDSVGRCQHSPNPWASIGYFLHHFDAYIRKITRRLKRLHMKILKRKQSVVFNRICLDNIYICMKINI